MLLSKTPTPNNTTIAIVAINRPVFDYILTVFFPDEPIDLRHAAHPREEPLNLQACPLGCLVSDHTHLPLTFLPGNCEGTVEIWLRD